MPLSVAAMARRMTTIACFPAAGLQGSMRQLLTGALVRQYQQSQQLLPLPVPAQPTMIRFAAAMARRTTTTAYLPAAVRLISRSPSLTKALAKQQYQQHQQSLLPVLAQRSMPRCVAAMARRTTTTACLHGAVHPISRSPLLTKALAKQQYQQHQQSLLPVLAQRSMPRCVAAMARHTTTTAYLHGAVHLILRLPSLTKVLVRHYSQQVR